MPKKSIPRAKFDCLTPILSVSDMQRSLAYYREQLGFKLVWEWGEPSGFACVARDGVELFFCEGAQGNPGMWISMFVDNVDRLHQEYLSSGATIVQPPLNFPWGVREMNIEDPDGHRFRMGSETTEAADDIPLAEG